MDYSSVLTPEIEAEMPTNLSMSDQFRWRQNKINEIEAMRQMGNTGGSASVQTVPQPTEPPVSVETEAQPVVSDDVPDDTTENIETAEIETEAPEHGEPTLLVSESTTSANIAAIRKRRPVLSKTKSSPLSDDLETIKDVPSSVMAAIRRMFPETAKKGDLISAFVYVNTNGDCEISERAMELVKKYTPEDKLSLVNDRLANLERISQQMAASLQSVELCTCYNTFDRRYGAKAMRGSPRDTDFREQGNLDMLARLRQQAVDQKKIDDITKGRQIYNQTKDKGDKT